MWPLILTTSNFLQPIMLCDKFGRYFPIYSVISGDKMLRTTDNSFSIMHVQKENITINLFKILQTD